MSWSLGDIPSLGGTTALVTGANSGLGKTVARELGAAGAHVVLACRSPERGALALDELSVSEPAGSFELLELDLGSLDSVARAASAFVGSHERLDLLVNNAGVMIPPYRLTEDGFELQFGTNHLGHFALTRALLPLLLASPGSRVVSVTSGAHHFGRIAFSDLHGEQNYDRWQAYGQSKLANTMFALALQERLHRQGSGTLSLAAHPGLARTQLQPTSIAANGQRIEALAYRLMDPLFQSAAEGALPQLQAATAEGMEGGSLRAPGGLGEMRGSPGRGRLPAAALRQADRERLWQISEELCAVGTGSGEASGLQGHASG